MHRRGTWKLAVVAMLAPSLGLAQQTCPTGVRVEGLISGQTGAIIPGATVQAGRTTATTNVIGHYVLTCAGVNTVIAAQAKGFAMGTVRIPAHSAGTVHINIQLAVAAVQATVQVNGNSGIDSAGDKITLNTQEIQGLADDPDDFLRELQVLASEAGGDPSQAVILVDGFQNPSVLPPKSSIASIRIDPDLFSARYRRPPFSGGVIEITTKPGADAFHGGAFFTDSDGIFNATDPFSVTSTPAGERRYGFELSGPIIAKKSGFSLSLEERDIDEFNVVNAVTLDADGSLGPNGNGVPEQETVSRCRETSHRKRRGCQAFPR